MKNALKSMGIVVLIMLALAGIVFMAYQLFSFFDLSGIHSSWSSSFVNYDDDQNDSKDVVISHQVTEDVNGETVEIRPHAEVAGSIEASQSIQINGGKVTGDLIAPRIMINADEFKYKHHETARIQGNVAGEHIQIGPNAIITGQVGKDDSYLDLAGHIQGDVSGKHITLRQQAIVGGDVKLSGNQIVMEPGAEVSGSIMTENNEPLRVKKLLPPAAQDRFEQRYQPEFDQKPSLFIHQRHHPLGDAISWLGTLIGLISIALLAQLILKSELRRTAEHIWNTPWKTLWTGMVTLIVSLSLIFLLSITLIGIPVAIGLLIALLIAWWIGLSGIAYKIGLLLNTQLKLQEQKALLGTVFAVVILAHLFLVPWIGWLIIFALGFLGLGSVTIEWFPRVQAQWRAWRERRKNNK